MAGLKRVLVVTLLVVGSLTLSTCVNPLLDTVRIMVEESTDPLRVSYQPDPGTYTVPQPVQLSASKVGAAIRYTTDGSEPTEANGTLYAGAFDVAASTTIRARAFLDPYSPSEVAVGAFTIPFGGQTKKMAPTSEVGAEFGLAVAIDGDYAIMGAPFEDGAGSNHGAAYIFQRTGSDTWDSGIRIVATNPTDEHAFGYAVDIDGDYVIVGTQNWLGRTSAYIFYRTGPGNVWDGGVKIDTANPQDFGYFGDAVAISGDYAVVGAFGEDGNNTDSGAAYVFHRTGVPTPNTWSAPQKLIGFDSLSNDAFGHSVSVTVSVNGDYIIAGAPWYNSIGPSPLSDVGAAYTFHRTGTNSWDPGSKLLAGGTTEENAEFGCSVDLSGDYGIIGAQNEDVSSISQAGAAYTIHRIGTNTWEVGNHISAFDLQTMDYFGSEVAISGDYAIVAAKMEDEVADRAGAIYSFHRTAINTWDAGPTAKWTAFDGGERQFFGCSVGIDGMYAIVGANGWPTDVKYGAAYILY